MIETLGSLFRAAGHNYPAIPESRGLADARPGTWLYDALTLGVPTYTGRSVNAQVAMTYTAVYACVKILSEAVASLPLITYRNLDRSGLTKEPAVNDYRYRLLREQPNREMSSFQVRENWMVNLTLWGNSFSWLDWNKTNGYLRGIWPVRSDWMMVLRNEAGRLLYRYQPAQYYSSPVPAGVYEDWEILHIPGLGFDGSIGYSPITMARQAVALGLGLEEFSGRFFANNARPNLLLTTPVAIKDPKQVKDEWHANYGGLENTGKVGVLHGPWDVKTFSINPKDAQFLEGREWQLGEIARIFGVPLNMLADVLGKASTYASAEQFDLGFAKHTIRPWCTRIEQKVNTTILGSQDALTCKHDMSDLVRGDSAAQADALTKYAANGIITRNEARARLDLNPMKDGDQLTVQQQNVPLGSTPMAKPEPKDTTVE